MRSLKDFTDLLVPLQEAYGQLETKYELQRAMLHEKHAENARLREALEHYANRDHWKSGDGTYGMLLILQQPLPSRLSMANGWQVAEEALVESKSPHGE